MRPDILEIRSFYRSRHGTYVRRRINTQLRSLWPDTAGLDILGIGFATPFLNVFDPVGRAIALMPATQGAASWPDNDRNRVALGREDELPFEDGSFDRVLLAHALECSPHTNRLMREAWRVLRDGGRLIVIVPNRHGLWCWSDRTPFGFGQPYSPRQLERALVNALFTKEAIRHTLYLPTARSDLLLRLAAPSERIGLKIAPHFSGVIIAEASKQFWAATRMRAALRPSSRRYAPIARPVAAARASSAVAVRHITSCPVPANDQTQRPIMSMSNGVV